MTGPGSAIFMADTLPLENGMYMFVLAADSGTIIRKQIIKIDYMKLTLSLLLLVL